MVHFIGAGPGAPDLITLRGKALLEQADTVIYAGSLVNPVLLGFCRESCRIYNSARMTLEEMLSVMRETEKSGGSTARLHTGDPSLYGAIREQIDALKREEISYDLTPGVSSFCAAAAAAEAEYTLPGISQTVIITRMAGRTPVPEKEKLALLAQHGASMAIFLSAGLLDAVQEALLKGAYTEETPCAIVYKASWPEERVLYTRLGALAQTAKEQNITHTALILAGDFLGGSYERSRLYDPSFTTGFRSASEEK